MKYKVFQKEYLPLIQKIRENFDASDMSIWERRNRIKVLSFHDEELTVKSFKVPHIINKIAYTFLRDSKAKRSYDNSVRIAEFVPKPIGYAEFRKFGLLADSYFLSEKYVYDFTIREVLITKDFQDKEKILAQFAAFTYALHEKGIHHLDYSPGNILIKQLSNSAYEFKIIDVNRMQFKSFTAEERLQNFAKLWASEEDLIAIVKAYAKISNIDEHEALDVSVLASKKHKEKVNLKKKLKGKKVVD